MNRATLSLFALLTLALPVSATIPSSERDALIALYNSTGGPSWTDSTNWLGAVGSECTWAGIRCDDNQTTVTGIFLEENNLTGTLPNEIGNLPNLEDLELYINAIGGEIPTSIGNLSKLRGLLLFDNQLSGSLPASIGNLSSLEDLYVDRNSLGGALPTTIGGLTSLINLSINGNLLEGPLPSGIGQLVNVEYFDLSYNQIGGPLPSTIGMMAKLRYLYLNDNQISGSIPAELGGATRLVELGLSSNQLMGSLPSSIGSMPDLVVLGLYNNQLSGTIPASLGGLPAIETIDLAQNALTGNIPSELGNLVTLRELWLSSNQLIGPIPPELGNLTNLERLQIDSNKLTGTIPPQLGNLSNLLVLSLGFNELSGTLPGELGKLKKLFSLSAEAMSLEGKIPTELTGLTELVELILYENQLTGTIPPDIGNLTKMEYLLLGGNFLTGGIPAGVTNMREMVFLDLRGNTFTGTIPPDIGNLTKMVTLQMFGNALTGPIPTSLGNCTELEELRLGYNRLSGVIPPQLGNLTRLRELHLQENRLEGTIPPEVLALTSLESLLVGANRFAGTLPSSLGNLTNLYALDVGNNAFRGEVPGSLQNLTNLADGLSDFGYNALMTSDSALRSFLNEKQDGGDWESTQTVAPTDVRVLESPGWNFGLTPIRYVDDEGGYRVEVAQDGSFDPPLAVYTSASKYEDEIALFDLAAGSYDFRVYAVTHPHGIQQNTVESDPVELSATAFFNIFLGELVTIGSRPETLVQSDGEPNNETYISLLNNGDLTTSVTIATSGDFFEIDTVGFTFDPGDSETIGITSIPGQAAGELEGTITIVGNGTPVDGLVIPIKLVSSVSGAGTATAVPSVPRLDLSADRDTNPVGSITFTNVGNASLSGVLESDSPWIVPESGLVTIPPGASESVTFTLDRSKRPDGAEFDQDGSAFSGVLRLVYASGSAAASRGLGRGTSDGSGVSASLVTVVDSVKPTVSASGIPGLNPGEVGLLIPGVRSVSTPLGTVISDLSIANAYAVGALSDLRVFYNGGGGAASVASFPAVRERGSLLLADAVSSIYDADGTVGVAQVRTNDFNRILVGSQLVTVRGGVGTFSAALPVFRTNRGVAPGESIHLTGLRRNADRSDIIIQSMGPDPALARVDYLDASGSVVITTDPVNVGGWDVAELRDSVPPDAVTAVVTNRADSASTIAAYAINWDDESGDSWIVTDWGRYFGFDESSAMKIPVARLTEPSGPRRRPVRRGGEAKGSGAIGEARGGVTALDLSIFNPGTTPAIGTMTFVDANGTESSETITLAARETRTIENVLGTIFRRKGSASGYIVFTPDRGGFAVSGRIATSGGSGGSVGASVPVLAQSAGLRLGQSQIFAGLEDSRQVTIDARQGGTHRTQVGIVETTGEPVTVRAKMLFYNGKSLAATVRSRDFEIPANGIRLIDNLARSIIGAERETSLGDLHDFQVEFRVVGGSGAVTVFTETFDNGTGDSVLRTE